MKTVQTLLAVLTAVVIFFGIMIFPAPAEGAVMVTTITKSEFDTLIGSNEASFSVIFRGGANTGTISEEIRVARNTAFPTAGGDTNTLIGQLPNVGVRWSQPITDIQVTIDEGSYISARAASTVVSDPAWAITRATNQVLILTADSQILGRSSTVSDNVFDGSSFRNLFADGNGSYQYDVVSVTGFGEGFDYKANWAPSDAPGGDLQYVWVVGLNNPQIPEPEVYLLFVILSSLFLWKRNR